MEWRFGTVFVAIGSFDPALIVKSFKTQTLFTKHPILTVLHSLSPKIVRTGDVSNQLLKTQMAPGLT